MTDNCIGAKLSYPRLRAVLDEEALIAQALIHIRSHPQVLMIRRGYSLESMLMRSSVSHLWSDIK